MYQEKMYKKGLGLFHDAFGEMLISHGFTRDVDGYYIANVEAGYILSVVFRPINLGDKISVYVDLNPISEGWEFLADDSLGRRICSGDKYDMLDAFVGIGVAIKNSGNLEFFINRYFEGFREKVLPVLLTICDEASCYESIKQLDKILPTQLASNMYMTAIACRDYKTAKSILRRIIRENEDWRQFDMERYKYLLSLLENRKTDELSAIIEVERNIARERYAEYMKTK